jgi:hypothetical protein
MPESNAANRRAFLEKVASTVFAGMAMSGAKVEAQPGDAAVPVPTPPPPFEIDAAADEVGA